MFSRLEEDTAALGYARDHLIEYLISLGCAKRARTARRWSRPLCSSLQDQA
ncbi:MAG: hypothetical protein JWM54_1999 [Acidobacteriaceae bacterium]|nr:hypothetical protein [Acidobacteriaceae bacterium]